MRQIRDRSKGWPAARSKPEVWCGNLPLALGLPFALNAAGGKNTGSHEVKAAGPGDSSDPAEPEDAGVLRA